jgi:hypothetical protein
VGIDNVHEKLEVLTIIYDGDNVEIVGLTDTKPCIKSN